MLLRGAVADECFKKRERRVVGEFAAGFEASEGEGGE
jgi:hypothetical protein